MGKILSLLVFVSLSAAAFAGDSVTVPWEEFRQLYRESVEREVAKRMEWLADREEPTTCALNEARYVVRVAGDIAIGEVRVTGRLVSGPPRPIPLFAGDMAVSALNEVAGGDLLNAGDPGAKMSFLPRSDAAGFQVALSFLARVQEDGAARAFTFEVPAALQNVLRLELPPGAHLLEAPGIPDAAGEYHFSPKPSVRVRFLTKESLDAAPVEIDAFSRISIKGEQAVVTTTFVPLQPLVRPISVRMPPGARDMASSLDAAGIAEKSPGSVEIHRPPGQEGPFWLRFSIGQAKDAGEFSFMLPSIDKNDGNEGSFLIEEPLDGQARLIGEGVVSGIPVSSLARGLGAALGKDRLSMRIAREQPLRFHVARFQVVSAAPIVLDTLYLFASFEENGNSLSTLVMDVPAEAGSRLALPMIPDTSLWSLSVNGENRKVYVDGENAWVIPLAEDRASHIELALLRKGAPLGLRGRLEAVLPRTNLSIRKVCVGIALPQRVQLLSIEGPVSPAPGESWKLPGGFTGKPHYFSRAFHKGEEIKLALSYKEPVKQTAERTEASQ